MSRRARECTSTQSRSPGPQHIGLDALDSAENVLSKVTPGSTGVYLTRLPISSARERGGADGCFASRAGAASPGPAKYAPSVSCISPRGCPVFAAPKLTPPNTANEQRHSSPDNCGTADRSRRKVCQGLKGWPTFTLLKNGKISGNLGEDSPGPGAVNVADYDPFRPTSYLKTGVCQPYSSYTHKMRMRNNVKGLRRRLG